MKIISKILVAIAITLLIAIIILGIYILKNYKFEEKITLNDKKVMSQYNTEIKKYIGEKKQGYEIKELYNMLLDINKQLDNKIKIDSEIYNIYSIKVNILYNVYEEELYSTGEIKEIKIQEKI